MALTIGLVAKESATGIETIRYYEREGLVKSPPRSASGYRQYPEDTVKRLRFIKNAKELGFSLKEIKEPLSLRVSPEANCCRVKKHTEAKIVDIKERIQELRKIEKTLKKITVACDEQSPLGDCPVLEALDR